MTAQCGFYLCRLTSCVLGHPSDGVWDALDVEVVPVEHCALFLSEVEEGGLVVLPAPVADATTAVSSPRGRTVPGVARVVAQSLPAAVEATIGRGGTTTLSDGLPDSAAAGAGTFRPTERGRSNHCVS